MGNIYMIRFALFLDLTFEFPACQYARYCVICLKEKICYVDVFFLAPDLFERIPIFI
jgi:hypothetical protein